MYRTIPPQVGGRGSFSATRNERVKELALAAGAVGSSYDVEAFAAVRAFQKISELVITKGSTILWFTNSRRLSKR